jgi:hypothetical protein
MLGGGQDDDGSRLTNLVQLDANADEDVEKQTGNLEGKE